MMKNICVQIVESLVRLERNFTITREKHQTFDCTKCGNTFGHGHKKRHLESCKGPEITRETIFSSDECEYQSKCKWYLNRHKKRKHSVRFLCDECGHVSSSLE